MRASGIMAPTMTRADDTFAAAEAALAVPADGSVTATEFEGLPEPVRRYLRTSIPDGTPLARSARLTMRGSIKLGRRWFRFRAREILTPHLGFVWAARTAGVITGTDRLVEGRGAMDWRLAGVIPVVRAQGPDVTRSAAGRIAGEAVWIPTAMLPRFGVTWDALDDHHATAGREADGIGLEIHYLFDDDATVRAVWLDRWGDHGTGFGLATFGHETVRTATLGGVTIPSAGRAGWFYGTDRWDQGEFFRYELTDLRLID
jgi:hypothetical protein